MLNSPFINWLLRFATSKGGFVVSAVVTWVLVHLGIGNLVSADDYKTIETGLNAGGLALLSVFYAWISSRQQRGVKVLQVMHNEVAEQQGGTKIPITGVAGNKTTQAIADANGISLTHAIKLAGSV